MVASLIYRTTDVTRWGGGLGFDLDATQIDDNFWTLFSAISALEDHQTFAAGIDFITQPTNGNIFYVHLTDHRVLGPFTIPTAKWTPRGTWAATTPYALYDTVGFNGQLYLVITTHTSGSSFSPLATDGHGNLLYVLILDQPTNSIPTNGTVGQYLARAAGSPLSTEWRDYKLRLTVTIPDQPDPDELLVLYAVVDAEMLLPAGLVGSAFFSKVGTSSNVQYTMYKNGSFIGAINFNGPSPETITVDFPADVTLVEADVLELRAPSAPDTAQADISITLVAILQ
jgi:hypothetical protein